MFSVSAVAGPEDQVRQKSTGELQVMVDYCDAGAAKGTLALGDIMMCSVAYDELVHHRYGSYEAYLNR